MHQRCVSDFCIESYIPFFLPSLSFPRHSVDKDLIRKDSSKILFGYNYACVFIKFGNLINACYVIYPFINHLVKYLKVHGVTDLDLRILASPREYTVLTFLNDSKIGRYPVQRQRFPVKKWQQLYMYTMSLYNIITIMKWPNRALIIWFSRGKFSAVWANLRAPSPCLLAMVPGYSGTLCTWSSPYPEYKSHTGLRGSPSCFATWKHILHIFYQGSYFSYYNFFLS